MFSMGTLEAVFTPLGVWFPLLSSLFRAAPEQEQQPFFFFFFKSQKYAKRFSGTAMWLRFTIGPFGETERFEDA